jgi:predicted O-methyltransferase YrrM
VLARLRGLTFARTCFGCARAAAELPRLPPPVRRFYIRAALTAIRSGDGHPIRATLTPSNLAHLLDLARGRPRIVEIGTAFGWTACALAIDQPEATVLTLDPIIRRNRARFEALAGSDVRSRVTFLQRWGEDPAEPIDVDLLFIDGGHQEEVVAAVFDAWQARVVPNGLVVLDDYESRVWPGPRRFVRDRGLEGKQIGRMFVWRKRG